MGKKAADLTPLAVTKRTEPGLHFVGHVAGLALNVSDTGTRSWILRLMVGGKRRDMGLGAFPEVSLAQAKVLAGEKRQQVRDGSPAYFIYEATHDQVPKFLHYLMRSPSYITAYLSISKGIRINQWDLEPQYHSRLPVLLPSTAEQSTIAAFLDCETAKIDALVSEQERLIELLKEKRQAVISHAVTKGLNPDAPMKPSGIQWLGDIPKHWEIKPVKTVSSCNDDVLGENIPEDYEIQYVEISGVDADRGISEIVTLPFGSAPSRARRRVKDGDVIVSTVRTYLRLSHPL